MTKDEVYMELFGMVFRHQAYILTVLSMLLNSKEGERVREVADSWMKLADVCSTKEEQ